LRARARIADAVPELRRARAHAIRGDAAWQRRLQRYEQGDAVIVELTASAVIDNGWTRSESLCFCHEVLWVDRPIERGVLAERLRKLARRDFEPVAARLRDRGINLAAPGLPLTVALIIDPTVIEPTE